MNDIVEPSLEEILAYLPADAWEQVERACQFARHLHQGQKRSSGTPFLFHVLETAKNIATWTHDPTLIICALLHDTLDEKSGCQSASLGDVRAVAGDEVAEITRIVHELGNIQGRNLFWGIETELLRKSSPENKMQAFLVKMASGLELATYLKTLPNDMIRLQRRGRELLAKYSPLAVQFGMWEYKRQLEDACLAGMAPDEYQIIVEWQQQVVEKYAGRLEELAGRIRLGFERQGLQGGIEIHRRHAYSVYQLLSPQWTARFQDILKSSLNIDHLVRMNVLVETSAHCYQALGVVHQLGHPAHDFLRDFVAEPKPNGYAALHTAIQIDPRQPGTRLRVNIRTHEMAEIGGLGILYRPETRLWLLDELPALDETNGAQACIHALIQSLRKPPEPVHNTIAVLTPQGKRINLPRGAMPLDFAYAVFTGLGDKFSYATVNHQVVSMHYELNDGDLVEIHTNPSATPQADWLEHTVTPRARQKIQHWLANAPREIGKTRLQKVLDQHGIEVVSPDTQSKIDDFVRSHATTLETILDAIGSGHIDPEALVDEIFFSHGRNVLVKAVFPPGAVPAKRLWIKLAECCRPDFPDEIVGCIRKQNVVVHQRYCANAARATLRAPMQWEKELPPTDPVHLVIQARDRSGLVRDVAGVVADHFYNMHDFFAEGKDGKATVKITMDFPTRAIPRTLARDFLAIPDVIGISSPDASQDFQFRQVEERFSGGMANPYSPGRPIFCRDMFFGRRQEISDIIHYLLPVDQPTSVMLCGQRRIGKTTLAWRIREQTLIRRAYLPVYLDVSTCQKDSDLALLYKLGERMRAELEPRGIRLTPIERSLPVEAAYERFEQNLGQIAQQSQKRLLLILDEFEAALSANRAGSLSDAFFLHLRSWSQTHPAAFLIVGSRRLAHETALRFPELSNIFQPYTMGPLNEFSARQLILEPARHRLEYDENAIETIFALTGRYPYYIHLLCARIYNQAGQSFKTHISLDEIESTRQAMCDALSRNNFAHLWNPDSPCHELLLSSIATHAGESNWVSHAELAALCGADNFDLDQTLRELLELETLEQRFTNTRAEYRIRLPLFTGWILQNFSLPQILSKRQTS